MSDFSIIYPTAISRPVQGINAEINAEKGNKDSSIFNPQKDNQTFYKDPFGRTTNKSAAFSAYERQIDGQNNLIIRHEEAHKNASGPQASGSPHYNIKIDPDGRDVIFGGYQMINVPGLITFQAPMNKIEATEKAAKFTIAGAEAPASFDSLSSADRNVASKGRQVLFSAQAAKQKRLELEERLVMFSGEKPESALSPKQIARVNQQKEPPQKPGVGELINYKA